MFYWLFPESFSFRDALHHQLGLHSSQLCYLTRG